MRWVTKAALVPKRSVFAQNRTVSPFQNNEVSPHICFRRGYSGQQGVDVGNRSRPKYLPWIAAGTVLAGISWWKITSDTSKVAKSDDKDFVRLIDELRNVQTEVHGKLAQIDLSDPNTYTNGLVARKALFDFVARLDKMHPSSADSSVVTRAKSSALAQAGLSYWITGDVNSARDLALRAINTLKNGTSEARKQNPLAAALLHSHDLMAGADDAADNTSSYDDLLKFCRDMVPEQEERAILTEEVAWAISTKILEAERIANIAATRAIDSLNDGDPWGDKAFASALPFLRLAADAGSRAAALAVTYTFAGRSSIAVTSQNGEQSALTKGKSSNIGHRNWGLARSMANVIGLDAFIPMLIALADRGDVESQLALARYTADGVPKSLNVFASFNEPTETSTFRSKAISSFKAIRQLVLDAENEKAEEATQHAAFEIYSQAAHLAESRISEARTSTRVARLEVARRLRFGIGTDANPSNALKIYRSLSREFFPVGVEQIGDMYAFNEIPEDDIVDPALAENRYASATRLYAMVARKARGAAAASARMKLSHMYWVGLGVEQSDTMANKWWKWAMDAIAESAYPDEADDTAKKSVEEFICRLN